MRSSSPFRSRAFALVLAAALTPSLAAAQSVAMGSSNVYRASYADASSAQLEQALHAMRQTLSKLVVLEQEYLVNYGTFTTDITFVGLEPAQGVDVQVLWARPDAWAARATHVLAPGVSCIIWAGMLSTPDSLPETASERKRGPEGLPVCDRDGIGRDEAERRLAVGMMRSTLWRLLAAQRVHALDGGYATELERLQGFTPWAGVATEIVWVQDSSIAVRSSHRDAPGLSCVAYLGSASAKMRPETADRRTKPRREGEVVCDS